MPVGAADGSGVGTDMEKVGARLGDVDGTDEGASVGSGVLRKMTYEGADVGATLGHAVVAITKLDTQRAPSHSPRAEGKLR